MIARAKRSGVVTAGLRSGAIVGKHWYQTPQGFGDLISSILRSHGLIQMRQYICRASCSIYTVTQQDIYKNGSLCALPRGGSTKIWISAIEIYIMFSFRGSLKSS